MTKPTNGPKRCQPIPWDIDRVLVAVVNKPINFGVLATFASNPNGLDLEVLYQHICKFARVEEGDETIEHEVISSLNSLKSYGLVYEQKPDFYVPTLSGWEAIELLKNVGQIITDGFKWGRDHAQP